MTPHEIEPGALSRQMPCSACSPHEHHFRPCDVDGCDCHDVPIPGIKESSWPA